MTTHIKDLIPDPKNARKHNPRNIGTIVDSLHEVGAARSIVIDENNTILAGNGLVEAAGEAGIHNVKVVEADGNTIIAVKRTGLSEEQKKRLALFDNRASELAEWDVDAIAELVKEDFNFDGLFNDSELEEILAQVDTTPTGPVEEDDPQIDKAEELQEKWHTVSGQLWQIGQHRLLIGDSTEKSNVSKLWGTARASCMWTDPPYGVSYVGKTKDALTIKNDGLEGLEGLLQAAFSAANEVLQDGAAIYIAHPAGALSVTFGVCFLAQGWRLHQTLVWVKDSMVLGHSDYHYKHEPILFGYKKAEGRRGRGAQGWYGDNSQVSVLEVPRPKVSEEHPTMKPQELIAICLRNSTKVGDLVYEPFGGSGSTFVAAEQLKRTCFGLELEPKYAAVILERLTNLGLTPKLIEEVNG